VLCHSTIKMQLSIFTITTQASLILSTLIHLSTSQDIVTNDGCSTFSSIQASCSTKFRQLGPQSAIPLSIQVCVCYDANNSYQPAVFEGAVNSCYTALNALPTSAFSDEIYQINSATAYPSLFNAVFSGFCGKYATYGGAPMTTTATTTGGASLETCVC
jgi:hypothetical protein